MPDKSLKNLKKLKVQAVEKHEETKEHKHESPAEKRELHKQADTDKKPEFSKL
jgi:hypothetical protein